jgi:hypothetical protein
MGGDTMSNHRTIPPAFVIFAIIGGLLFLMGGIITSMTPNGRAVLAAAAVAFVALGAYTITTVVRHNRVVAENDALVDAAAQATRSDAALRTRMTHTVREPLAIIVGLADRLAEEEHGISTDERRAMTREMRANAREVEQALADLGNVGTASPKRTVEGIVLLDDELRSVSSSLVTDTTFEGWLEPTRAWGDTAQVRQVLRTLVSHAASHGGDTLVLKTSRIGERAQATISGRCAILSPAGIAALTGNTTSNDLDDGDFRALRDAHDLAVSMGGTLGYAEAMGVTHIILELPASPQDLGITAPRASTQTPQRVVAPIVEHAARPATFSSAVSLRPERPTAAIRFS